jgi:FkbM family methyltransferase
MSEQVGPNGTVICFEPQKKIYRELIMNLILNGCSNVMSYRYAIGETEKVVHMCAAVPGNEGGTPIGMGGDEVMMKTLDSFKLENVSLLKIDVEGYEDYVLLGAKETIMRNRPVILIELMGGNDYDTSSPEIRERVDATKNILRSYNYSVSKVFSADYLAIPL